MTKLYPMTTPFPTNALPPLMLNAVNAAISLTQAPEALIASSCMAAASLAVQNLVDVERRDGLIGPISLFFSTICASGERKTTVESLFTRDIHAHDRRMDAAFQSQLRDHSAELAVWQAKKRGVEADIQRAIRRGYSTEMLEEQLKAIVKSTPKEPVRSPLLLSDATPAAIKNALRIKKSGIGIFADEASTVFNGKTFAEFALINSLWGGGTVNVDRVSTGRWTIDDCRLTVSLMAQPDVFEKFLERRGKEARDIGLFARMLIAYPQSTQGLRTLKPTYGQECIERFNCRVDDLLREAQKRSQGGDDFREQLRFDEQAQRRWEEIFDLVEKSVFVLGYLFDFRDYAAKYADNLARIAAVFHRFEGLKGDISIDTLERAQAISCWFLDSFTHLFAPPPISLPTPIFMQTTQDAEKLRDWLADQYIEQGITSMSKTRAAQYGPHKGRKAYRLNPALALLENWNVIFPRCSQPQRQIVLHPNFINHIRSQQGGVPVIL